MRTEVTKLEKRHRKKKNLCEEGSGEGTEHMVGAWEQHTGAEGLSTKRGQAMEQGHPNQTDMDTPKEACY